MRHHQLLPRPQHGDPEVPALPLDEYTKSPSQRIGGWSGEKQATFLRAIADVIHGMSLPLQRGTHPGCDVAVVFGNQDAHAIVPRSEP